MHYDNFYCTLSRNLNLTPTRIADIRIYQHAVLYPPCILFEFRGVREYLEDLFDRIDPHQLDDFG